MKKPRPLKALAGLSDEQIDLLGEWVDGYSYRKVVELARENFKRYIPKGTLQRFVERRTFNAVLDNSPEQLQAAREVNRFAARAEANFSRATIHLLERQAFELALARKDKDDLEALEVILFLLQRDRANDIHERRVRVQEQKLQKPRDKSDAELHASLVGKAVAEVLNEGRRKAKGHSAGIEKAKSVSSGLVPDKKREGNDE